MYGLAQQEAWRLRSEEIGPEVAAIRLQKTAREGREAKPGLWRELRWEFARYAGLLAKRLRGPDRYQATTRKGGGPVG